MIKTLTTTAISVAVAGLAHAGGLPVPPTTSYTAAPTVSCDDQTLQVYFPVGASDVSAASQVMLSAAKSSLDGCVIGPVEIRAMAADADSESEAVNLARARLSNVTQVLSEYKMLGANLTADITAAGTTETAYRLQDRSVEIHLAAWAPEIS